MLVAIKMGKSESSLLEKRDLRCNLALDLIPANAPENSAPDKFGTCARKPSRFVDQSRQGFGPQEGLFFHQRQMQANIQFRILPRQSDSILECTACHKQRGACYNSALESPHDTAVDGRRESQVIRVDNQLFQGAKTVPLGSRVASSSGTQPVLESF